MYPEFGTYPGGGESPIIPFGDEKNAEREIIHGRWAMLGVTGAWAAENGTGIPWFTAGTLCTPDDCTAVADKFPGAVAPLAPAGSGYPNFWAVLAIEIFLVGSAESYRTGIFENPFPELTQGDVTPGGRFDPLGFAEAGDLEELKIKELKHSRLSMFAWLGCIFQALATQEGPIANCNPTSRIRSTRTSSPTRPRASPSTKRRVVSCRTPSGRRPRVTFHLTLHSYSSIVFRLRPTVVVLAAVLAAPRRAATRARCSRPAPCTFRSALVAAYRAREAVHASADPT